MEFTAADLLPRGGYRTGIERVMHEMGPSVLGLLQTIFRTNHDAAEEACSPFAENLLAEEVRTRSKLPWDEVAQVMSSGGEKVDSQTVRKRFDRLKVRLGEEARRRGLVG